MSDNIFQEFDIFNLEKFWIRVEKELDEFSDNKVERLCKNKSMYKMVKQRMIDRRKEIQKVARDHMRILTFEAGLKDTEDEKVMLGLKTADKHQVLVRNFRILDNS